MSMRKTFLALLLAASLTPALDKDKTVNRKVTLWVPPAHPLVPATKAWAEDIEKASGGTIKMSGFPSEQLGKAFDHYDMARDGIADITYVNPGYQPGRFPIAAAGQLPFVFSDGKKGTLALNEWYHKYAPKEMKDTKLCFAFIHDPGALHGKKKIVVPSDLSGVKVRPAQSTIGEMVKMFGGTNVQEDRSPREGDLIGHAALDGVARFRRRGLHIGAAEHLYHFADGALGRAHLDTGKIAGHHDFLLAVQRAGIVDEGEAQFGVLHLLR